MVKVTSIAELRKMQSQDLRGEMRAQEKLVNKLRLGVQLQKEKDSAKYITEKKQLARMSTVLTEKQAEELHAKNAERTVDAPKEAAKAESSSPSKKS
tara:strand:- start:1828 stop:2118 length:291 start_codon:yes stop_codon:yes gene_type:complete